jgi:neutral/alkaline ceramidase-like enzyme
LNRARQIIRISVAMVVAVVLGLPIMAAEPTGVDVEGPFRAACVKVDITPDTPQWLHGYGPRKSEGVHDRIYHRIVAMDDGATTFYLVSTDVGTITPSFYHNFCEKMERETGITSEQIWWTATHTHSAPHVGPQDLGQLFSKSLGDRFSMEHDVKHWEWVQTRLLEGVKKARSRLEPARMGIGVGESHANVNRRARNKDGRIVLGVNPDGPVDRQIGLIRLERPNGSSIALIANYAIHGTALGGTNKLISGDVTGHVAKYVESRVGAPMLFINGAEGDVAPLHGVGADFGHSHWAAFNDLLGDEILATNDSISSTTADVRFSLGKAVIETPRKEGLGWVESLADYARLRADGANLVRVPVYSLMMNENTVVWAAPLELFSEIAMNVRTASPFAHTFYFGLTNGSLLYMPTSKAFAEGGYEVGVSPFTPQAEKDFTSGVIEHIQGLKRQ